MPTYSYACTECGNRFDAVQAFTDDALTECPQCTGRLRKLFGSVGVVFKGSGFYRTDSRTTSSESTNGEKKTETPAAKSNGDAKPSTDKTSSSDKKTSAPATVAS